MARIQSTCPDCGDVELTPRDIMVRVCLDTDEATYIFRCPSCKKYTSRKATPHVTDILWVVGCCFVGWRLPDEFRDSHRLEDSSISVDEILDFHLELQRSRGEDIIASAIGGSLLADDQ